MAMGRKVRGIVVSRMPDEGCPACHGIGAVRMTAHFHAGEHEFEWPCWVCFGNEVRLPLPMPDGK